MWLTVQLKAANLLRMWQHSEPVITFHHRHFIIRCKEMANHIQRNVVDHSHGNSHLLWIPFCLLCLVCVCVCVFSTNNTKRIYLAPSKVKINLVPAPYLSITSRRHMREWRYGSWPLNLSTGWRRASRSCRFTHGEWISVPFEWEGRDIRRAGFGC